MTLALVGGSTLAGRVFGRNGRMSAISRIGILELDIGALLLCLVGPATGMVQLACSSAMLGFGIGVNMPMTNIAAQTAVEPRDMGKVTSLALFFRGLGGTVGSAACGAVAGASFASAALPVFALCIGAGIAGLVLSGTLPRFVGRAMNRGEARPDGIRKGGPRRKLSKRFRQLLLVSDQRGEPRRGHGVGARSRARYRSALPRASWLTDEGGRSPWSGVAGLALQLLRAGYPRPAHRIRGRRALLPHKAPVQPDVIEPSRWPLRETPLHAPARRRSASA